MFNLGAAQYQSNEQQLPQRRAPMTGYVPPIPPDPRLQGRAQEQMRPLFHHASSTGSNQNRQMGRQMQPLRAPYNRELPYMWPPTAFDQVYRQQQNAVQGFVGVGNPVQPNIRGNHENRPITTNNPHIPSPFFNAAIPPSRPAAFNGTHGNGEHILQNTPVRQQVPSLMDAPIPEGFFDDFPEDFAVNQVSPRESESRPSSAAESLSDCSLRISESPAVVPEHAETTPNKNSNDVAVGSIPVEPLSPLGEPEVQQQPISRSEPLNDLNDSEFILAQSLLSRVSSQNVSSLKKRLEKRYHEEKRYLEQQAMNHEINEEDQENRQQPLQENNHPRNPVQTPAAVKELPSDSRPAVEPEDDEIIYLGEFNPNGGLNTLQVADEEDTNSKVTTTEPVQDLASSGQNTHEVTFQPNAFRDEEYLQSLNQIHHSEDRTAPSPNGNQETQDLVDVPENETEQLASQPQEDDRAVMSAPSTISNHESEGPAEVQENESEVTSPMNYGNDIQMDSHQEEDDRLIIALSPVSNQEIENPSAEPTSEPSIDETMNQSLPQNAPKLQDSTDEHPSPARTNEVQNPATSATEESSLVPKMDSDDDELMTAFSEVDPNEGRMVVSPVPSQEPQQEMPMVAKREDSSTEVERCQLETTAFQEQQEQECLPSKLASSSRPSTTGYDAEPRLKEKSQKQKSCSKDPPQPSASLPKKSWKIKPPPLPKALPLHLPQFEKLEERGIRETKWSKYCLCCLAHGLINKHGRVSVCRMVDCTKPHRCHWQQEDFEKLLTYWKSKRSVKRPWSASLKEKDEDLWDSDDEEPPISVVRRELAKERELSKRNARKLQKIINKRKMEKKMHRVRFFKKIHVNLRKEKAREILRRATSGDRDDTADRQVNQQDEEQDGINNKRKHAEVENGEAPEVKRCRRDQDGRQTSSEDRTNCGSTETTAEAPSVAATPNDRHFEVPQSENQTEGRTDSETTTIAMRDSDEQHVGLYEGRVTDEMELPEATAAETASPSEQAQVPTLTEVNNVELARPIGNPDVVNDQRSERNLQKHRRSLNEVVADLKNGAAVLTSVGQDDSRRTDSLQNETVDSSPCSSSSAGGVIQANGTTQPIQTLTDVLNDLQDEENLQSDVQLTRNVNKVTTSSSYTIANLLNEDVNSRPSEYQLAPTENDSIAPEPPRASGNDLIAPAENGTAGAAVSWDTRAAAELASSLSNPLLTPQQKAKLQGYFLHYSQGTSLPAMPSRANLCQKCLNHGEVEPLKGHKYKCKHWNCNCTEKRCNKLEDAKLKRKAKYLARIGAPPGGSL